MLYLRLVAWQSAKLKHRDWQHNKYLFCAFPSELAVRRSNKAKIPGQHSFIFKSIKKAIIGTTTTAYVIFLDCAFNLCPQIATVSLGSDNFQRRLF